MDMNISSALEDVNEGYFSDYREEDAAPINPQQAVVAPVNSMNFVKSKKEKEVLNHDGYLFWKCKAYKEKIYWECVKVDSDNCKARLHTKYGQVVKLPGPHSHGKSAIAVPIREVKNKVKKGPWKQWRWKPSNIFNSVLSGVLEAVQARMDKSAERHVVHRKRKLIEPLPAAANGMNFVIPAACRTYTFGMNEPEQFLLADEVDGQGKRILLFGREGNKAWAGRMKVVFMDGTFKITPLPFYQVYVILAARDGYVFPVLYALLPNKSQATYEWLFQMVKRLWPDFYPTSVSVDYEMAVINALEVCFVDSEVWGCFFHLVQNLKKCLRRKKLMDKYESDGDFAVMCRMIIAMAFVKPEDVMPVFEKLQDVLPAELDPVVRWFQRNYIGSIDRRKDVTWPLFAHSLWNLHGKTLAGQHRTNNYAEAANHRIQTELDVCHPGLWIFINCLKQVQQGRYQKYL